MEYTAAPPSAPVRIAVPGPWRALWRRLSRSARPASHDMYEPAYAPGSTIPDPPAPAVPYAATTPPRASGPHTAPAPSPGPQPTISELYHAQRLNMVRLAVLLVDDRATAEDVVQDAFAALYRRHGERLGEVDNAPAYLRTAVVNAARSVLRRRRTARAYTPPYEVDAPSAEEHIVLDEEHREVLAALGQLTARRREVLVLRYWSDLTEAQIAATLGISRGSVKSIASRALDSLEKILEARS
ncbi:sigma-70 family RNA polymerase sigma factor [Streptomyces sp. MST-110588]|uniref:RNA polymerase sigma factor n=1 Tax=Streptomyces sp. MST-110588 TaxID=2833628 RepID=UPI001F5D0D90|nr:sigma-70 family RNA polymerase sigma factor [Streptomyces sp. MST-110588]UNO40815.1 sigma-70 family RNA polymerase sigma factor [Streptomyces sp. MST-110588]